MHHPKPIDIQGHRGARGLYPENTVTAFIEAIKLGVNTLEMDVVISKDLQVVVSHEAWMNDIFCTRPDGSSVEKNSKEKYNLFKMDYSEIARFDCGSKGNVEFPLQKKMPEHKPLLSEVITTAEAYIKKNKLPAIHYDIEIKTEPGGDGCFHPYPKTFVALLFNELNKQSISDRMYLQSFDVKILQEIKMKDQKMKIALLVEDEDVLETQLNRLGFTPDIYSPNFCLVTDALVKELQQRNISLIPWTVNEIPDMKRLIAMGVNGIISDYPDRVIDLVTSPPPLSSFQGEG